MKVRSCSRCKGKTFRSSERANSSSCHLPRHIVQHTKPVCTARQWQGVFLYFLGSAFRKIFQETAEMFRATVWRYKRHFQSYPAISATTITWSVRNRKVWQLCNNPRISNKMECKTSHQTMWSTEDTDTYTSITNAAQEQDPLPRKRRLSEKIRKLIRTLDFTPAPALLPLPRGGEQVNGDDPRASPVSDGEEHCGLRLPLPLS